VFAAASGTGWLANRLIKAEKWLKAGQVVSSGSCNIFVPARQGDSHLKGQRAAVCRV